jgi:hypothetical protein
MKRGLFARSIFSLLCLLIYHLSSAQVKVMQKQIKLDCYTTYKNGGDAYNKVNNYDLAIQQYQAAKYCPNLNNIQRKTLDSLITDVTRKKQMNTKKVILRKY